MNFRETVAVVMVAAGLSGFALSACEADEDAGDTVGCESCTACAPDASGTSNTHNVSRYSPDDEGCVLSCDGVDCGDDGCGGSCGSCAYDETCRAGTCVSECTACMDDECASETARCESNWECVSLLSCVSSCYSDSCVQSCLYSHIGGANDLLDLLECMDDNCLSEC